MQERFYYLVSRKLTGEASISEQEELAYLLKVDEELKQVYTTLFADSFKVGSENELAVEQTFAAHSVRLQVEDEMEERKLAATEYSETIEFNHRNKNRKKVYVLATLLTVFIVAGILYFTTSVERKAFKKNEIATKNGSKLNVVLPDGTTVWLNSDTKLTYGGNFNQQFREVFLTGEGYFDVVKNKEKPFIIHTDIMDIKVVGTAFNVRSYPEESTIETSLIHGSIEVTLKENPDQKIFLKPNDKLIIANTNHRELKTDSTLKKTSSSSENKQSVFVTEKIRYQNSDSLAPETAWMENKLCFDHETFEKVISKIQHWYNVEFIVKDKALLSLYFTATFEKESLEDVLGALQASRYFHFQIKNEKVIIW